MHESEKWKWSRSVVSDSSQPRGLQPTRLLHPWDFAGKSTGVGCHCLLREREQDSVNSNETPPSSRVLDGSLRNRGKKSPILVCSFKKKIVFFLARLICQTRLTSLPSIWVTEPQVQRCHRTRWVRATPRNRTSLPGWLSLLAFSEGLKTNVGCWEARLPGLALGPLSGPHCTGHQIPQALRDVYFCTL